MTRSGRPGRYTDDVLAPRRRAPAPPVTVAAEPGLLVTHRGTYAVGRVVRSSAGMVVLRLDDGAERTFRLSPGAFLVDRRTATLVPPRATTTTTPRRTPSGSIAAPPGAARVARASRIWVEGVHDAELLEKVWGDDLRHEAVVVEPLGGADDLQAAVDAFRPSQGRRLGVLLDHLVDGSKESRLAARVVGPHVLVTGHPYVDVWAGVRPRVIGLSGWPDVPHGRPWKEGVCAALGVGDPRAFWRRLLRAVDGYADLEQPLVGAVERLIDFVTEA